MNDEKTIHKAIDASSGNPPGFPPMPSKALVYQWTDDNDVIYVGTIARTKDGCAISCQGSEGEILLLRHSHTGDLEWVPQDKLAPYPSEPISDPY